MNNLARLQSIQKDIKMALIRKLHIVLIPVDVYQTGARNPPNIWKFISYYIVPIPVGVSVSDWGEREIIKGKKSAEAKNEIF